MYNAKVVESESECSFVILIVTVLAVKRLRKLKSCSGVAITKFAVLTAAHCLTRGRQRAVKPESVHLRWKSGQGNRLGLAKSLHLHPGYDGEKHLNDIAALLSTDRIDTFSPAGGISFDGRSCSVYGYGEYTSDTALAPIGEKLLRTLPATVLSSQSCDYSESLICVVFNRGQSICEGDSGGPLICDGKVAGVLSRGVVWGNGSCGTESLGGLNFYESLATHKHFIYKHTGLEIKTNTMSNSKNHSKAMKHLIIAFTIFIKYLNLNH